MSAAEDGAPASNAATSDAGAPVVVRWADTWAGEKGLTARIGLAGNKARRQQ